MVASSSRANHVDMQYSPATGLSGRPFRRQFLRAVLALCGVGAAGVLAACGAAPTPPPAATQPPAAPTKAAPPAAPTKAPAAAPTAAPKPTTQAPAKPKSVTKLRLGLPTPGTWQAPYYLGIEKGIWAKHGIDLEPVHLEGDPVILKGVVGGDLQLGDHNPSAQLVAIAKGAPAKIIGAVAPGMSLALGVRKEISSLRDLYGRPVAVSGPGDLFTHTWRALFKKEGLDVSQLQMVTVGGSAANAQALVAGKIEGALFIADFIPTVSADPNVRILFVVAERLPEMAIGSLYARDQLIQEQPDVVQNLMLGAIESVRYVLSNKQETVDSNVKRTKQSPEVAGPTYDAYIKAKIWNENGELPEISIAFSQEMNKEIGEQESILPIEKVSNRTFQQKALAQLGPYKR